MTSTANKFDGGQSYATHSFMAGTACRRKDGPGHWLVAYREAQEQDYRKVQRRIKAAYRTHESETHPTLDGPLLLQLHCINDPSKLSSVDIRERKLTSVKSEDFRVFKNVVCIDASINALSLGFFSTFESLRELFLPLNGICNMTFDAAKFPHLEVLDLSYNRVSGDDVISLGRLPRLKVLHLSANQLHHLPSDLSSSNSEPTQVPKEDDAPFRSLQYLMLDDNKLSSSVFSSLRNLKRLKYLNLKGNCISEIPILQLTGSLRSESLADEDEKEGLAHRECDSNTDEYLRSFLQVFQEDDWEERCREDVQPLPELQVLDLASNQIAEEEVLMAAALFPMLREIDIQSNPLVTERRGESSLLMYLQVRLGITIKRKKTADILKLPRRVSTGPEWKVDQRVPKVSKKSRLINATCPAHSQATKSDPSSERPAGSEGSSNQCFSPLENTESIFITQAADVSQFDVPSEDKETAENKNNNRPEQCTDFNTLMDAKPNPDASGPSGISTAPWKPPHTPNSLDVYSNPRLDSIQTLYSQNKKRHIMGLAPLKPIKLPAERTDEMMKTCRESTTVTVIPFGTVLRSTNVTRAMQKEAQMLLKDMKTKYKGVYEKAIEELGSFNSEDTHQEQAEPPPEPLTSA